MRTKIKKIPVPEVIDGSWLSGFDFNVIAALNGIIDHLNASSKDSGGSRTRTYYITFSGNNLDSWVIRETVNDLSTVDGLVSEIELLKAEHGYPLRIESWKELSPE